MVNIDSNPLYYASIGGIIIGLATSINYSLRGSVTGMSGMVYGTVNLDKNEMPKNIAIIGGMLIAAGMFFDIFGYGRYNNFQPFGPKDQIAAMTSYIGYGVAGLLVGFGTKLSNGCTSGHGLCGIARFSIRSIVAVCSFLLTGMAIATIGYHEGGLGALTDQSLNPILNYQHLASANICIVIGVLLPLMGLYLRFKNLKQSEKAQNISIPQQQLQTPGKQKDKDAQKSESKQSILRDQAIVFLVGLLFGIGLLVAGMVKRSNIIMFLSLGKDWNPSLMFVLGCGLIINLIVFNYFIRIRKSPIYGQTLFNPQIFLIDWKLILGAICFGLGWGIGGLCPGPTIMHFAVFTVPVHCIWLPCMIIGQLIANQVSQIDFSQRLSPTQTQVAAQKKAQTIPVEKNLNQIKLKVDSSIQKDTQNVASDIKIYQQKEDKINQILHEHGHGFQHAKKLAPLSKTLVQQESDHNLIGPQHQTKRNFSIFKDQNIKQLKETNQLLIGSGKYHIDGDHQIKEIKIQKQSPNRQKYDD